MTTAKKKNPPARKRSTASKSATSGLTRATRFVLSAGASALASFLIASCSLTPPESTEKLINKALASAQLPDLDALRKNGWPGLDGLGSHGSVVSGGVDRRDGAAAGHALQFAQCPEFFPARRAPSLQIQANERELCFSNFAVLHNGATKTPVFVAERLNRQALLEGEGLKRTNKFYADARLPRSERAELDDYKHSGYSRGHMAPAGDMSSAEGMAQSFSLANMVPQNQVHNSGAWSQAEQATRKYALRAKGDVYVFTGPIFAPNAPTIGAGKVAVPEYLFKLVYDASTSKSWVYWQANSAETRMGPPISYDEFTRRTGMPLLAGLPVAAH